MDIIHNGLVARAFQTIALAVLLVAGAATNAMGADAAGIPSKQTRPADA